VTTLGRERALAAGIAGEFGGENLQSNVAAQTANVAG
jgi:hypothetical protein